MTASLILVLESLWGEEADTVSRQSCAKFLCRLCADVAFDADEDVRFRTQSHIESEESGERGQIDAELTAKNKRVWIEVKDRSRPRKGQLAKYRSILDEYPDKYKALVLLRHFYGDWDEAYKADSRIYWFEVYDWLEDVRNEADLQDNTIEGNMIGQFLHYLTLKGVRIVDILDRGALAAGLIQLSRLRGMLRQVAGQLDFKVDDEWETGISFSLDLKHNRYNNDFIGRDLQKGRYYAEVSEDSADADGFPYLWIGMNRRHVKMDSWKLKKQEQRNDSDWAIAENDVALRRSLMPVLTKLAKKEQIDELGTAFKSMFEQLMTVQSRRRGRPRSKT